MDRLLKSLVFLSLQAPNRRVVRAMEKENKKVRDAAKKKRNETVKVEHAL